MSDLYFEGVIDKYVVGDGKNFGFISYQNSGRENRVFFPASSVRLDSLGRRGHSTFEGALVRFRVGTMTHKGQQRTIALDIHPVFVEEIVTSIEDHREVSQVVRINPGQQSVWLRREDESEIFLHKEQAIPEHLDRFQNIRVNDYVYHGIRENGDDRWGATCAEIFSREEQLRLQQGLPAQEPEVAPVAAAVDPDLPELLAPQNKSKTLFELVLEKRGR